MLKDIWVQVVVTLSVAAILALLGIFSTPFQNFVVSSGSAIYGWLTATSSISRWWYWTLVLGAVGSMILLIAKIAGSQAPANEFTSFRRFGMIWQWNWRGGVPAEVTPFCPACNRMMRYTEPDRMYSDNVTMFACQNCSNIQFHREGTYNDTIKTVKIEIEHADRTGSWKTEVPQRVHLAIDR